MTMNNQMEGTTAMNMNSEMMARIAAHYNHAKRKHPYFADRLMLLGKGDVNLLRDTLAMARDMVRHSIANKRVAGEHLLHCEIAEMFVAIAEGDEPSAVEEAYDTIAVLLRMIDVLEGRQKLGKEDGNE